MQKSSKETRAASQLLRILFSLSFKSGGDLDFALTFVNEI